MNHCSDDNAVHPSCNTQLAENASVSGALSCDAWHPHYHFQASGIWIWLAESLRALAREPEAQAAYAKALFQDHRNAFAVRRQKAGGQPETPDYTAHPLLDAPFRLSTGRAIVAATIAHDAAAVPFAAGEIGEATAILAKTADDAFSHESTWLMLGKCSFLTGRFDEAVHQLAKAAELAQQHHDAYHREAALCHLARGRHFYLSGATDLAVNAFTKALDLDRHCAEALRLRAEAYRAKGSVRLGQQDEARLAVLNAR